jgi:hypothetical protein
MSIKANDLKMQAIPIELDKPRNLLYTLFGLSELQDAVGSFDELMERLKQPEPRFKDVYLLVWAGLVHEDDALTPKQVANMIDLGEMPKVLASAMEAFMAALPETQNPTTAAPAGAQE